MRSKILAFLILGILLLIPLSFYWYYYHIKVSSVLFSSSSDVDFTVLLQGTLDYPFLPLADKALVFSQKCHKSCLISPLPPVQYTFSITSDSKNSINDTISLAKGGDKIYNFDLYGEINFTKFSDLSTDESVLRTLITNANDNFTGVYLPLGILRNKHVFALRNGDNVSDIGVLTVEKFTPLITLPFTFVSGRIDVSKSFFILRKPSGDQYIVSPTGKSAEIFPYSEKVVLLDRKNDTWKVKTEKSVYTYENGIWIKNPRFSDYIDISPRYRIGYIDGNDKDKLKLGNYPLVNSLFLLLDRENGNVSIIEKNRNISGFVFYNGLPSYINSSGEVFSIDMKI